MRSGIDVALAALAALGLAGCETTGSVSPTDIAGPSARYMVKPAPLPPTPAGAAMNGLAEAHLAALRATAVRRGRTIDRLQAYVRTIARKPKRKK